MKKTISVLLILTIIILSCQKEINSPLKSPDGLPVVVTNTLTTIADTFAIGGGNVLSDGGSAIIARGICWSTIPNPSITDNHSANGTGLGSFIDTITGLLPSTAYHFRAYATNGNGTAYGTDSAFITSALPAILPVVTTNTTTLITATTATSGGNVISDGGEAITARGICWGTAQDPDITGNHTSDGTGTGSFVSNITGLLPSTTYHVRAYATNSTGTAYGGDSTFITAARDVYIVGYEDNSALRNAILWKNGIATILTSNVAIANAVFVSGNDVYVGGSDLETGPAGYTRYAKIWKNGAATTVGNDLSEIYSVAVSGNDVYAVGYESVGTANAATVWKNGVATHLSNGVNNAIASSVFINGADVYIVGSDGFGSKIWKNGVASSVNGVDAANAVYVLGTDIYVAGHSNNGTTQDIAVIWKNGVATNLTNGIKYADAKSVFVSGTDVYVTGFESSGPPLNPIVAKIWKNGTEIILPGTNAQGNAIIVSDGDVYVAGDGDLTSTGIAKVWKNGIATSLSNGTNNAQALSMFVK